MELCWNISRSASLLLVLLLQFHILTAVEISPDVSEHIIQKRNLREDGYTHFTSGSVELRYRLDEKSQSLNIRHVRETRQRHPTAPMELHVYSGDDKLFQLEMNHARNVFNENAEVMIHFNNELTLWNGNIPDCFLVGQPNNSSDSIAIISYCGTLKGIIHNGNHSYWLETVDTLQKNNEPSREQLILARKDKTPVVDRQDQINTVTRHPNKHNDRLKRAANFNNSLTIETLVVIDAEYYLKMNVIDYYSDEDMVTMMGLKWAGVQAELGKQDVLHYIINVSIMRLVIWKTNPYWYVPSKDLDSTLQSFCYGAYANNQFTEFDLLYLFAGLSGTNYAGEAYVGKLCTPTQKCAVSTWTSVEEYVTTVHEIGHSLGMSHDQDLGCFSPNEGIMGTKTSNWSTCSVNALNQYLQGSDVSCLYTTNVNGTVAVVLEPQWPGMLYSIDEICAFKCGRKFRYRSYPYPWGICTMYSCTLMDISSPYYGISFAYATTPDGLSCGDNMVCSSQIVNNGYSCVYLNTTGLNPASFNKTVGGWSEWGQRTPCSRTCGTGVQYRQRYCNNPKPKNTGPCTGKEYDANVCNTQPCSGDSADMTTLIKQRAGETCSYWKQNKLYERMGLKSDDYLNTGSQFYGQLHGQCEVKCDTVSGIAPGVTQRFGLMPDGTPCTHDFLLSSFVEMNSLPRRSGMFSKCVQGYCILFASDGTTSDARLDGCGVLGGNNSTCKIVENVSNINLPTGQRTAIALIPARAYSVQVYLDWPVNLNNYIELRSKSDIAVVASMVAGSSQVSDTRTNPTHFAGAFWNFWYAKQYLFTEGPINQAVNIKLYNAGSKTNIVVSYGYSLPLNTCPSGTCLNGGMWNTTTCSCDCKTGYYGLICNETCSKYCKNGMFCVSGSCVCGARTYGGPCNCRYPFMGKDCGDCKITTCLNGGVFNSTGCRCQCPAGFGDLDCSTACIDARGNTTSCQIDVGKGNCNTNNEVMEKECYKSCGLCTASSPMRRRRESDNLKGQRLQEAKDME